MVDFAFSRLSQLANQPSGAIADRHPEGDSGMSGSDHNIGKIFMGQGCLVVSVVAGGTGLLSSGHSGECLCAKLVEALEDRNSARFSWKCVSKWAPSNVLNYMDEMVLRGHN